jgi:hypothetical protein
MKISFSGSGISFGCALSDATPKVIPLNSTDGMNFDFTTPNPGNYLLVVSSQANIVSGNYTLTITDPNLQIDIAPPPNGNGMTFTPTAAPGGLAVTWASNGSVFHSPYTVSVRLHP